MKNADNFAEIVSLVREGSDVSHEELVDAWSWASDGVNEMYRLCKALISGYRAQQTTIQRKQSLLEAKIKEIESKTRTIWVLNAKLRSMGYTGDPIGEERRDGTS